MRETIGIVESVWLSHCCLGFIHIHTIKLKRDVKFSLYTSELIKLTFF